MTLVFTSRGRPEQRLDLSPLVPHRLAGMSAAEISRIALQTTRASVTVGDAFHLRMGGAESLRIEGGCERLDQIGAGMTAGEIQVIGNAGAQAGRLMTGGRLIIHGSAGPWAASGMRNGLIEITGSAGDRLGGPLAGEVSGMRGGVVVVRRNAGVRAADRLRRGTIIIEGNAGDHAGSRMIAGTLIVGGLAGALPGYLMKRGTIVLARGAASLLPTFADCGVHRLVAMRLIADFVRPHSKGTASALGKPLRRLAGDMAVSQYGEIFMGNLG